MLPRTSLLSVVAEMMLIGQRLALIVPGTPGTNE